MTTKTIGGSIVGSDDESWSLPEIVRSLARIEIALSTMSTKFVSKELHDQQVAQVRSDHIELAKWVTDIAASCERAHNNIAQTREAMLTRAGLYRALGVLIALMAVASTLVSTQLH